MFRIGFGYDSHPLGEGKPLVLGGVRVEHDRGLIGHSDCDVVLHALTDAILGAVGEGDIGEHFDDKDPAWADADSAIFVQHAVESAAAHGWRVANCDVTVLAERPRLKAHKPAMQARIAELLGVAPSAVGVKAKTNEGLGPVGREECMAALAAVLLAAKE